jgi:hypothetical protein
MTMHGVPFQPPSALPGISPTGGEIECGTTIPKPFGPTVQRRKREKTGQRRSDEAISPLEGEMPGRAEGGGQGLQIHQSPSSS